MSEENEKEIVFKLARMISQLDASTTIEKEESEEINTEKKCVCGNIVSINAKYCDKCGRCLIPKERPKVIIKKIEVF
ncbi:MAG: hypothetical protein QW476_04890 [Candidatus Bathyarchaeia archaeon]|nr:hypothetical protein [Candidatus Bathyarchaeota archaeon]